MQATTEERLRRIEERLSALEDLDDRVDGHDSELAALQKELRGVRRDLDRVLDAQTSHGMVLQKIHDSQERLLRVLTPTVMVTR